jgi:hypothetical protein
MDRPERNNPTPTLHKEIEMKTITTLIAALAASVTLLAAPAVQASEGSHAGERGNPYAALPYLGSEFRR